MRCSSLSYQKREREGVGNGAGTSTWVGLSSSKRAWMRFDQPPQPPPQHRLLRLIIITLLLFMPLCSPRLSLKLHRRYPMLISPLLGSFSDNFDFLFLHKGEGSYQGAYYGQVSGTANDVQRNVLDEVELRELLIDYVGHCCCWGSRPARTWKIRAVEDCNVYVGTLDTFVEEREVITEKELYLGGDIDGKDKGPELGVWELDLRSEFPVLFTPSKESHTKIPHSEVTEKCAGCEGRGQIVCVTCNAGKDHESYKENQMNECPSCYGRGLIAHRDGSDTVCQRCKGKGKLPCATCGSRGLIKCEMCNGASSLLTHKEALIRWKTLTTRKVSASPGASSVPDEIFHRAKGVQLCNTQAYQCTPAFFADSYFLNKFSSEVIAERAHVPPTSRVICERHVVSVVPVTRVTMAHRKSSFSFYAVGFDREVYLRDYYPSRYCWGLCPCLEWLKL